MWPRLLSASRRAPPSRLAAPSVKRQFSVDLPPDHQDVEKSQSAIVRIRGRKILAILVPSHRRKFFSSILAQLRSCRVAQTVLPFRTVTAMRPCDGCSLAAATNQVICPQPWGARGSWSTPQDSVESFPQPSPTDSGHSPTHSQFSLQHHAMRDISCLGHYFASATLLT
jgi:hypothetical protein